MEQNKFIGIGRNSDGPDLPLGLGMRLAQEPKAMEAFGMLSKKQKVEMIGHIQQAVTGEDAKNRIEDAVGKLSNNQIPF